eukprot:6431032-Alexandrium_andersonii.AAC.1
MAVEIGRQFGTSWAAIGRPTRWSATHCSLALLSWSAARTGRAAGMRWPSPFSATSTTSSRRA